MHGCGNSTVASAQQALMHNLIVLVIRNRYLLMPVIDKTKGLCAPVGVLQINLLFKIPGL